jgi:hypothetical protein
MVFLKRVNIFGKKRKFLILGFLNFLITNAVLQISLLILPILISTLLSQIINVILGCYLYGKKVFKVGRITPKIFKKYLILACFIWLLNYLSISFLLTLNIPKNIGAVYILPMLVLLSYLIQNRFVFITKSNN